MKNFREALGQVPTWTVLAWSNQLLSLLYSEEEVGDTIYPLMLRLSQDFPQALWFAFNFVQNKDKYPRIKNLLEPPKLVMKILSELGKVSLPSTRTYGFLESLEEINDSSELNQIWKKFEQDNLSEDQTKLDKIFFTDTIKTRLREVVKKRPRFDQNRL